MEHIFDTHAHYFDKKFEAVEGGADAILCDVFANGVAGIVNVGTNLQNARDVIEQASRYEKMYAAIGIHPEDCHFITAPEAALAQLFALLEDAEAMLANEKYAGTGIMVVEEAYRKAARFYTLNESGKAIANDDTRRVWLIPIMNELNHVLRVAQDAIDKIEQGK